MDTSEAIQILSKSAARMHVVMANSLHSAEGLNATQRKALQQGIRESRDAFATIGRHAQLFRDHMTDHELGPADLQELALLDEALLQQSGGAATQLESN